MNRLEEAKSVFDIEILALKKTRDALDETYLTILDMIIRCNGKIIITGIGKPGHIAAKIAATFASLGIPSFRLHPAEAMHGDLGMISSQDIVIVISLSGESDEITHILPNIKLIGAPIIGITGNPHSTLAHVADVTQVLPKLDEACSLGLAPTSSTTAELCYGDSLAVVASKVIGFNKENFALFHPAGSIGKKLIVRVSDLMKCGCDNAVVQAQSTLKDAIIEISNKGLGAVSIVDPDCNLVGIITDGDLRRLLEKGVNVYELNVKDIMSCSPFVINQDDLAIDALRVMKEKNISCLPVVENNKAIGMIRLQDIIGVGILG